MSDEHTSLDEDDRRKHSTGADEPNGNAPSPDKPSEPQLIRIDLAQWGTKPIPPRDWTVHDRFLRRNVSLLSGEGGLGKSLLMLQLGVAHILGQDWLRSVPEKGRVMIINCEEEEEEIIRRLRPILDHYGASFAEVDQSLDIVSLAGKDAVLAYPDHQGRIVATQLFMELKARAIDTQPINIMLDNAADIFSGSEIDRAQVRQFITLLRGLSMEANAGVLMSSHPSLTGLATKTGTSGSTGWHNSVRGRAWLKSPTTKDGDEIDRDLRELEFKKNQYGPLAETILLRWKNGLYLPEPRPGSLDQMAADKKTDDLFLSMLKRLTEQGQNVVHKKGPSYAPAAFAELIGAKGTKSAAFAKAMQRLLDAGQIGIESYGPPSRRWSRLVIK